MGVDLSFFSFVKLPTGFAKIRNPLSILFILQFYVDKHSEANDLYHWKK